MSRTPDPKPEGCESCQGVAVGTCGLCGERVCENCGAYMYHDCPALGLRDPAPKETP